MFTLELVSTSALQGGIMTEKEEKVRKVANQITKDLAAQGKIIQGGWRAYEIIVLPENAGDIQRSESRQAFFAGAQHLWASIMVFLDAGTEPTDADLKRMDLIQKELDDFVEEMKRAMKLEH
jgi:hypothetical protein